MSAGALEARRRPGERTAAWLVTGPLGHLYGFVADAATMWARWAAPRVRARVASRLRSGRARAMDPITGRRPQDRP